MPRISRRKKKVFFFNFINLTFHRFDCQQKSSSIKKQKEANVFFFSEILNSNFSGYSKQFSTSASSEESDQVSLPSNQKQRVENGRDRSEIGQERGHGRGRGRGYVDMNGGRVFKTASSEGL